MYYIIYDDDSKTALRVYYIQYDTYLQHYNLASRKNFCYAIEAEIYGKALAKQHNKKFITDGQEYLD